MHTVLEAFNFLHPSKQTAFARQTMANAIDLPVVLISLEEGTAVLAPWDTLVLAIQPVFHNAILRV